MDDNSPDKPDSQSAENKSEAIIDAVHEEELWSDPRFEAFNDPVFSPAPMKE